MSSVLTDKQLQMSIISMDSKERFNEKKVLLCDQGNVIETCIHKLNKCHFKRQLDLLFRVL